MAVAESGARRGRLVWGVLLLGALLSGALLVLGVGVLGEAPPPDGQGDDTPETLSPRGSEEARGLRGGDSRGGGPGARGPRASQGGVAGGGAAAERPTARPSLETDTHGDPEDTRVFVAPPDLLQRPWLAWRTQAGFDECAARVSSQEWSTCGFKLRDLHVDFAWSGTPYTVVLIPAWTVGEPAPIDPPVASKGEPPEAFVGPLE